MNNDKTIFHSHIFSILLPGVKFSILAGLIVLMALFFKGKFHLDAQMIEAVFIFEAVMIPFNLIIMLTGNYNKVIITPEGIHSRTPFSKLSSLKFIPWDAMKKISFTSILGYRYCLIESSDRRKSIWVPIEITQRKTFHNAVFEKVGITHRLSTTLTKGDLKDGSPLLAMGIF